MVLTDKGRNKIDRASIMGDAQYWLHNPQDCMKSSQGTLRSTEAEREEIP